MSTSSHRATTLPDKELFSLSKHDGEAFEELYRRWNLHLEKILRQAGSGLDPDDVEDILSITWLKVYDAIQRGRFQWRGREAFRHWLERILANARIDFLRWKDKLLKVLESAGYKLINLNDTLKADDGDEIPLEELIAAPEGEEVIKQVQRERALDIVCGAGLTKTELEVALRDLMGQEPPAGMSRANLNTVRYRVRKRCRQLREKS